MCSATSKSAVSIQVSMIPKIEAKISLRTNIPLSFSAMRSGSSPLKYWAAFMSFALLK